MTFQTSCIKGKIFPHTEQFHSFLRPRKSGLSENYSKEKKNNCHSYKKRKSSLLIYVISYVPRRMTRLLSPEVYMFGEEIFNYSTTGNGQAVATFYFQQKGMFYYSLRDRKSVCRGSLKKNFHGRPFTTVLTTLFKAWIFFLLRNFPRYYIR